jgi:hypothetical protein
MLSCWLNATQRETVGRLGTLLGLFECESSRDIDLLAVGTDLCSKPRTAQHSTVQYSTHDIAVVVATLRDLT